jgi:DNA replication and repair protein RecF
MSLKKIEIHHFRNIAESSLAFSENINLIVGPNASGKTSLLEAIFMLGRARSFKAKYNRQMIAFDQKELVISGQILNDHALQNIGVKVDSQDTLIRIDQANGNKSELAYAFPVLAIHPKSYLLLDGGPQLRREFVDWGAFNHDENFLFAWRMFKRALMQRNAALKARDMRHLMVWDQEFIQYGSVVEQFREKYIYQLRPFFEETCQLLFDHPQFTLDYVSGWDGADLSDCLKRNLEKDLRYGFTNHGPHRADFQLMMNHKPANVFCSRSQLKLIVLSLLLAQAQFFNLNKSVKICLLIDDLPAEMDVFNLKRILKFINTLNTQVFMSCTHLDSAFDEMHSVAHEMFHVEHGDFKCIRNDNKEYS